MRSTRPVRVPATEPVPTEDTSRPIERLVDRMPRYRPAPAEPFHGPLPFHNRSYRGQRNGAIGLVTMTADGVEYRMPPSTANGFGWAALTAESADLSRAILLDFLGFEPSKVLVEAFDLYTIARLQYFAFVLFPQDIRNALRAIGRDSGISCLRCLDERTIDGEFACPVCRPGDPAVTL